MTAIPETTTTFHKPSTKKNEIEPAWLRNMNARKQQLIAAEKYLEQEMASAGSDDVFYDAPSSPPRQVVFTSAPPQEHKAPGLKDYRRESTFAALQRRGGASVTCWVLGGMAIAAAAGTGAHALLLPGSPVPRALVGVACCFVDICRAASQDSGGIFEPNDVPAWPNVVLHWMARYAVLGMSVAAFAPASMGAAVGLSMLRRAAIGLSIALLPTAVREAMPGKGAAVAYFVVRQAAKADPYLVLASACLVGASLLLPASSIICSAAVATVCVRQVTGLMVAMAIASGRPSGAAVRRATSLAPRMLIKTALPLTWSPLAP